MNVPIDLVVQALEPDSLIAGMAREEITRQMVKPIPGAIDKAEAAVGIRRDEKAGLRLPRETIFKALDKISAKQKFESLEEQERARWKQAKQVHPSDIEPGQLGALMTQGTTFVDAQGQPITMTRAAQQVKDATDLKVYQMASRTFRIYPAGRQGGYFEFLEQSAAPWNPRLIAGRGAIARAKQKKAAQPRDPRGARARLAARRKRKQAAQPQAPSASGAQAAGDAPGVDTPPEPTAVPSGPADPVQVKADLHKLRMRMRFATGMPGREQAMQAITQALNAISAEQPQPQAAQAAQ